MTESDACPISATDLPQMDPAIAPRPYPKRKRAPVYYVQQDDIVDLSDDAVDEDEEEYSPKKVKLTGKSKSTKAQGKSKKVKQNKPKIQKPFQFLDLPAELRNVIYNMALVADDDIFLVSTTKAWRRKVERGSWQPNMRQRTWGTRGWQRLDQPRKQIRVSDAKPRTLVPGLLAVNKQLYHEAASVLYKQPIVVQDTMALHFFLAQIGPMNRQLLEHITITAWGRGRGTHHAMNYAALTLLAGATKLRTLHFDCDIGHFRKPRDLARQLFRDGSIFLHAYATANGRQATMDMLELNEWNFDPENAWPGTRTLPGKREARRLFQQELMRLLS